MTDVGASPVMADVRARRDDILATVRRHRGRSVLVFGSVARGEEHSGSDIDLLVDFEKSSSLFDLLHLQDALEELLGRSVDLVSLGSLTSRDDHIRAEAIPL